MKPDTRCPVEQIEYVDEQQQQQTIECFDNNGVSKGLLAIVKEFGVAPPTKCTLQELKAILSKHKAFANVSSKTKL